MKVLSRVVTIGLALALWPSPTWAQRGSTLDVGVEMTGEFDSDVADEIRRRSAQSELQSGGYSSSLIGTAGYTRAFRRLRLNSSLMSAVRYYAAAARVSPTSHTGGVTARVELGRRTNLLVTQTAAYSPAYLYQLFPSTSPVNLNVPVSAAPQFRVDEFTSFGQSTRVGLGLPFVFGGSLSASADRNATEFYGRIDQRPPVTVESGSLGASWRVGARYSLSAEYSYRQGNFGSGLSVDQHFRIGAEYSRPLSTTRRAAFRFSLAPSIFRGPATGPTSIIGGRRGLDAATSASVNFTRTWAVNANLRRRIEYIPSLTEPILNNAGSLGVGGALLGRLQLGVSGGFSQGASALNATAPSDDLRTYTGSLRLSMPVTRSISAYGEYLYYHYNLRGQATLAPGLPSVFERRSVMFGVTLSARPIGR